MTEREKMAIWAFVIGVAQGLLGVVLAAGVPHLLDESGVFAGAEYEDYMLAASALPGVILMFMGYRSVTWSGVQGSMAAATRRNRRAAGR